MCDKKLRWASWRGSFFILWQTCRVRDNCTRRGAAFLGERVVRPSERRLCSLHRGEVGTATSGRGYRSRLLAVLGSRFFGSGPLLDHRYASRARHRTGTPLRMEATQIITFASVWMVCVLGGWVCCSSMVRTTGMTLEVLWTMGAAIFHAVASPSLPCLYVVRGASDVVLYRQRVDKQRQPLVLLYLWSHPQLEGKVVGSCR